MKIFINATGPDSYGGYYTYVTNLILNINKLETNNYYIVLCNGNIYKNLKHCKKNIFIIKGDIKFNSNIYRFFWMQCILPFKLLYLNVDVLLSTLNAGPFILKFTSIKSVIVVHSNLPWIQPENLPYSKIKAYLFLMLKNLSIKFSDAVICVSKNAKKELCEKTNYNINNFYYTYLGINNVKKIETSIKSKYILYVANSAKHHNHIELLKAFNFFNKSVESKFLLYLVIDAVDKIYFNKIKEKIDELNISNYVKIIEPKDTKELSALYSNASLYVFPSLSETFGMTTLESMACGTPVICSNLSAMPEINGNAALYFNPHEYLDIADKMQLILNDDDTYYKMIKKGYKRVEYFSWLKTAQKTDKLLGLVKN